jgi:hypothetical protein
MEEAPLSPEGAFSFLTLIYKNRKQSLGGRNKWHNLFLLIQQVAPDAGSVK